MILKTKIESNEVVISRIKSITFFPSIWKKHRRNVTIYSHWSYHKT